MRDCCWWKRWLVVVVVAGLAASCGEKASQEPSVGETESRRPEIIEARATATSRPMPEAESTPEQAAAAPDHSEWDHLVVARVGDAEITLAQLLRVTSSKENRLQVPPGVSREAMIRRVRHSHLDHLVVQEALRQEVKSRGIEVSDREVDMWIERSGGLGDLETAARRFPELAGMSEEEFRKGIRINLAKEKLQEMEIARKIEVPSEEEIRAYYDEHREEFRAPSQASAFVIVTNKEGRTDKEARRRMEEIRQIVADELDKAKSIGEMTEAMAKNAREYSEHEPTRKGGGWWVVYDTLPLTGAEENFGPFWEHSFEAPVQELSPVLEMEHAYYVSWVRSRTESVQQPFEKSRESIQRLLLRKNHESVNDAFYGELKETYPIQVFEENLTADFPSEEHDTPENGDLEVGGK